MRLLGKCLTRAHWHTLLWLLAAFAMMNFLIVRANGGVSLGLWVALGTILGPLTGAMARYWQSCCTEFSLFLLPYSGAVLLCGLASQLLGPLKHHTRIRLISWALGWFVWFFSGIVSFGHALE